MSGDRKIWTNGEALTVTELQRVADVAASSEDRVWNVLMMPDNAGVGTYDKKVYPLLHEPPDASYRQGRCLVYGGSVAPAGGVNVLPALYVIGALSNSATDANGVNLSAEQAAMAQLNSTYFPSSIGNGYSAVVYALVQRVATTAARKVKDVTTGNVSTQTITVYSTATVTFGVLPGPADGTMAVPSLPADSATAWYIKLANVTLGSAGVAWTAGSTISQANIQQAWNAGWIRRNRVQLATPSSIMAGAFSAGVNGRASTLLTTRWGASISCCSVLQHYTAAAGSYQTLDNSYDWSRRLVRIDAVALQTTDMPDGTAPRESRPSRGYGGKPVFTGATSGTRRLLGSWDGDSSGTHIVSFYQHNGDIEVEFAGTPMESTPTPILVMIEGSDQFLF